MQENSVSFQTLQRIIVPCFQSEVTPCLGCDLKYAESCQLFNQHICAVSAHQVVNSILMYCTDITNSGVARGCTNNYILQGACMFPARFQLKTSGAEVFMCLSCAAFYCDCSHATRFTPTQNEARTVANQMIKGYQMVFPVCFTCLEAFRRLQGTSGF